MTPRRDTDRRTARTLRVAAQLLCYPDAELVAQLPLLRAATDSVHDTLQRQIQRYKEKHWRRGRLRRQGNQIVAVGMNSSDSAGESDDQGLRIVRTKEFQVKPMHSDEAVEQMELLGHDFFVFRDAETNNINVLYRRHDGNYGLIVPGEGE